MAKDDEILSILSKMVDEQREHRSETARSFAELDKKVDLHVQKTEYELKRINDQDEIQNQLLYKHIEGVNTLRVMHESHVRENKEQFSQVDKEIDNLKAPRKWVRATTKVVLWLGGIGTALMGVLEIIKWLKGI